MKSILSILVLFSVSQALASDSACVIKLKNAASFQLAQSLAVAVQDVTVISTEHSPWTEAVGNNIATAHIVVGAGDLTGRSVHVKKYQVDGQQIGVGSDCDIKSVVELL